jgi:hypothetical protein
MNRQERTELDTAREEEEEQTVHSDLRKQCCQFLSASVNKQMESMLTGNNRTPLQFLATKEVDEFQTIRSGWRKQCCQFLSVSFKFLKQANVNLWNQMEF